MTVYDINKPNADIEYVIDLSERISERIEGICGELPSIPWHQVTLIDRVRILYGLDPDDDLVLEYYTGIGC